MPIKPGKSRKVMASNYRELRATGRFKPKQIVAIMLAKAGLAKKRKGHA